MAVSRKRAAGKATSRKPRRRKRQGLTDEERDALTQMNDARSTNGNRASRFNWLEIEHAYIHGIRVEHEGDDDGSTKLPEHKWPTFKELASEYGCSAALIGQRSKRYGWVSRREVFRQKFHDELDAHLAEHLATSTAAQVAILDRFTSLFSRNLARESVRADNIGDLDKALRLREFLLGHADRRSETNVAITLEAIQERHREARERTAQLDPVDAGLVVETEGTPVVDGLTQTAERKRDPKAPHTFCGAKREGPPVDATACVEVYTPPDTVADSVETRQPLVDRARKDSINRPPFDPLNPNTGCRVATFERGSLTPPDDERATS